MELDENKEDETTPVIEPEPDNKTGFERPCTPIKFKPTTAQQLRLICWKVKPWDCQKDRTLFTSMMGTSWGVDCDEVHQNLFIGDKV